MSGAAGDRRSHVRRIAGLSVLAGLFAPQMFASVAADTKPEEERTGYLREMIVGRGETVGEVTCIACSIHVYGTVRGDATSIGGNVEVDGTVEGDAVAVGGAVRLRAGARVVGDATSLGGPVVRDPQAVVQGEVDPHPWMYWPGQREPYWQGVLGLLGIQLGLFLVFYLAARARRVLRMAATLERRPVWSFLAGTLAVALMWFLLVWMIRWNFEKLLFSRYFDAPYWAWTGLLVILFGFGHVGLACRLGRSLRLRSGALAGLIGDAPLPVTAVGILLIFVLELVPVVGTAAFVLFALLGIGAAVLSLFGTFPRQLAAPAQGGVTAPGK